MAREAGLKAAFKSTKKISGDTLARTLHFNAQCFLISNMFEIARGTEALVGDSKNIELYRPDQRDDSSGDRSGLDMIAPILSTETRRSAETFSTLVMPGSRPKRGARPDIHYFLDLTTDKMAYLVPKLQIFKVEYETIQDGDELKPNLEKSKDIEIIFDDFTTTEDLERIFEERQGRLSGTGIKSFKWSLKGVNPAEVDANITAQLTIHFNDVSDLFTDQKRNRQLKAGRREASSFLDLIIYAPNKATKVEGNTEKAAAAARAGTSFMIYDGSFF